MATYETNTQQHTVRIDSEGDIVRVRKTVREAAIRLGFSLTDTTRIVTAASELARNVYRYAGAGTMMWNAVNSGGKVGIQLIFDDSGPGIPNVAQAMEPGFTTAQGLGLGLPGAKRLMDEMEIDSEVGRGTTVTARKWIAR